METTLRYGFSSLAALALVQFILLVPICHAVQIVVDVNQGGDYETIQDGIDAASEGDTVLVHPGTYTGEGNRDIGFGTKNIVLRGRDGAEATIIDPGYGVYRCMEFRKTGQDTTCVIDGFTIQGGHLQTLHDGGAGISIDATIGSGPGPASPKFTNCIIRDNYNSLGEGGGVYLNQGPSPVFRNVVFEDNYSYAGGGGVYATFNCNATFSDCVFRGNENALYGYGGGLTCKFESNATLFGCAFEENIAAYGAGLSCTDGAHPTITNCTFYSNSSAGDGSGAGLYCSGSSMPTLTNCTFYASRITGDGEGQCVYTEDNSHPVLLRCLFSSSGYVPGSRSRNDSPPSVQARTAEPRSSSFYCQGGATIDAGQCCSFGNAYGNDMCGTVVCGSGFLICEDPLFCDPGSGDLSLAAASPCLPGGNTWGARIGAHGEGCTQPAVEPSSWGAIKAIYR